MTSVVGRYVYANVTNVVVVVGWLVGWLGGWVVGWVVGWLFVVVGWFLNVGIPETYINRLYVYGTPTGCVNICVYI